ncbi:trimeric intracellular cation channel family protein [Streptomyces sp. NPDC014676]|uniref:trimeric intracellular cation channel family protein n=1 Tax=Streptomyces sp. NPDC014676 TaxID=3364879 RepID=UPI0036FF5100
MSSRPAPLLALDLTGTFAFGLNGALTAVRAARLDVVGVVVLGMITAVGGGTIRDTLVGQVPTVLRTGLYAIPALVGAAVTVLTVETGVYGLPAAPGAATACFLIRVLGLRFGLNAPEPPETRRSEDAGGAGA